MSKRILLVLLSGLALVAQPAKRPIKLDDLAKMKDVRDPQCSPDGKWVAYVLSQIDVKEDRNAGSHIWMVSYDGKNDRQITFSTDSESSPKWSPDGKYLSFTSSRPGKARGSQVWLLDRSGGEAMQLTDVKGRLTSYDWSPDSKKLLLVVADPDPDNPDGEGGAPGGAPAATPAPAAGGGRGGRGAGGPAPKPIVIDRYKYKQDGQGYLLTTNRHSYLYLFDLASKKTERVTTQTKWDEGAPSFSPDGTRIAFTSNRNADPDRDPGGQLFVVDAKPGSTEKQLTPIGGRVGRSRVDWSPDGKWIAFLEGEEKKWSAYGMERLALVPSDGSQPSALVKAAAALDRGVSTPRFTRDGKSIMFLVTDDQSVYPARMPINGQVERLMASPIVINSPNEAAGCSVVMSGGNDRHAEIHAVEGGKLRQITRHNDELFAELDLGKTQEVSFKSKDGTEVHGLLTTPVGYSSGKVPMLLRIHGGPNGQDAHSFSFERHFFSANGYAVLNVNYRGSAGRGQKFSRAIAADWGNYEVQDLQAGVDHVIKMGIADPDKLGVGGWSYGGILTDYMIASDTRFKAATSGAGTAFTVAFYGTDQYIIQYDNEIGPPWTKAGWDAYVKISYPFLHADRIKTPTMFLGGERDFNVPIQGSQQMYQALRSLGIDTQLIIYPNENHGITRPSYQRDRYERYLGWYDKYIKGKTAPATSGGAVSTAKDQ